jgi:hypothetical protein
LEINSATGGIPKPKYSSKAQDVECKKKAFSKKKSDEGYEGFEEVTRTRDSNR